MNNTELKYIKDVQHEYNDRKNNKLEKAKEIIKKNFRYGDCGLVKSRNILGDPMHNIYNADGLKIDICFCYSYFEVFGLNDEEFKELKDYYVKLEFESEEKNDKKRSSWSRIE